MVKRRVFLIVLDSFGIGEMPDAQTFGDKGCNTLARIRTSEVYHTPNMEWLGLFQIDGVRDAIPQDETNETDKETSSWKSSKKETPIGTFGRMKESSKGKDTTIGHWEIAGVISPKPLPVYPNGFPEEILDVFRKKTGRDVLCNLPYSGTDVIRDYGEEHRKTGALIVYTSADSVFQIAAHEDIVPLQELYRDCEIAREILVGTHGVGRVIARPFTGTYPHFQRTANRHDFSLTPPRKTMLDVLQEAGYATYGIGKIYDIFAGQGISHTERIQNNTDGMKKTIAMLQTEFSGLCFVNLVDFDMVYGHRRDIKGYAQAATEFDRQLGEFLEGMRDTDILMITADHGCDPGFSGTDHTREYTPLLIYGNEIKRGYSLGTRESFADIAATILDLFELEPQTDGNSMKDKMMKDKI